MGVWPVMFYSYPVRAWCQGGQKKVLDSEMGVNCHMVDGN